MCQLPVHYFLRPKPLQAGEVSIYAAYNSLTWPGELLEGNAHAADVPMVEEMEDKALVHSAPPQDITTRQNADL